MTIENDDEQNTMDLNFIVDLHEHAIWDNFHFLAQVKKNEKQLITKKESTNKRKSTTHI